MRETRNPGLHLLRIAVMKVLVVGGGGREHAIVEALRRSQADVYAAMSNQNPGIRRRSKDVLLGDVTDVERIVSWARGHGIELAVIGPEAPLEKGISDALEAAAIPTVGPSREAAGRQGAVHRRREPRGGGVPPPGVLRRPGACADATRPGSQTRVRRGQRAEHRRDGILQ